MSLHPSSESNNGVLVFVDADKRADIDALCRWENAGMLKGPPERLEEGVFVATLAPGVHDVVARPR